MKKIISLILITIFALSFMAISVNAQCSLSISPSKKEVLVGDTFTVTFSFNASATVESADATIQYDSSKFQYVKTAGGLGNLMPNQQGKTVKISDYGTGATSKTYKITMTFKALAVGSGNISVTSSDIGDANFESLGSPTGSTTVSVKEESKSNNANLSSLTVPAGCKLVPAFSKNTTSYTCTVPYEVTKFPMDWTTEDKDATTSVTALQTLKVGENSRTVTVTAPDGTKKSYTVKVIREQQKATPTPTVKPSSTAKPTASATATATATATPTAAPSITIIDGNQYNIVEKITLQLPENYKKETYVYDSKEIEVAVLGDACLVQLFDGTRDMFFVYDKAEQKFTPFRTVKSTEKNLTVLDKKPELSIELAEQHIVIGDGEYIGWTSQIFDEGYYILNVINGNGENYIALYCQEDGSIQKLSLKLLEGGAVPQLTATPDDIISPLVTATPEATIVAYTPAPTDFTDDKGFFDKIPLEYVGIAVCVLLFIAIIIIVIILAVGNSRPKKSEHDWGFEETSGFNFVVEDANNNSDDSDDFE